MSWCICKLLKYEQAHTNTGERCARVGRDLWVCVATHFSSLNVCQEMVYTNNLLTYSRTKPGGGVNEVDVFN